MKKEFKVLRDCYYGEAGEKAIFYKADAIYTSETLTEEKAPKFLKLIVKKVAPVVLAPQLPHAPILPKNDAGKNMSYNEMKKFVAENDIETENMKGETLAPAIIEFLGTKAELAKDAANVEQKGQEIASELGNTPAAPLTDETAPDKLITNAE